FQTQNLGARASGQNVHREVALAAADIEHSRSRGGLLQGQRRDNQLAPEPLRRIALGGGGVVVPVAIPIVPIRSLWAHAAYRRPRRASRSIAFMDARRASLVLSWQVQPMLRMRSVFSRPMGESPSQPRLPPVNPKCPCSRFRPATSTASSAISRTVM